MDTVTGQQEEMVLVPRRPTSEMLDAAFYPALAEDALAVWNAMIMEYENSLENGKLGLGEGNTSSLSKL